MSVMADGTRFVKDNFPPVPFDTWFFGVSHIVFLSVLWTIAYIILALHPAPCAGASVLPLAEIFLSAVWVLRSFSTSNLGALFDFSGKRKGRWTWFVKTNNPASITLWKIFLQFFRNLAAAALWKRALAAKIPLKMEKQRFKPCSNLCQPRFHLWSYLRILRIKNCRTHWDDWLFRHFIYSVRQSWWTVQDSNLWPHARQEPSVRILLYFNYNMCIFYMKKFCFYGNFSIASIAFLPSLGHGLGQAKITPRPA